MATNLTQIVSAGLDTIYAGLVDADGLFGGTTAAPAEASDNGGFRVLGPQSADLTIPEMERVNVPGSDGRLATFQFDAVEESGFIFEAGAIDMDMAAASQKDAVDDVASIYKLLGLRPGRRTPQTMWWVMNSQAKSQASGSLGNPGWLVLVLKVEVTYLGPSGIANRGPHTHRFSAIAQPADTYPWGQTPASGMSYDGWLFHSENRMRLHRHEGDNSDTTFTLSELPVAADRVHVYKAGTLQTITTDYTVNTETGVVTYEDGSKPGAGVATVVLYEIAP